MAAVALACPRSGSQFMVTCASQHHNNDLPPSFSPTPSSSERDSETESEGEVFAIFNKNLPAMPSPKFSDIELRVTKTVELNGKDVDAKREEIRQYFHKTYSVYERLFEVLKDEHTVQRRPEPLRHPLIFYWGHTATFFVNKLRLAGVIKERINPKLESMLAIGVDEMSWDDLSDDHYDWPTFDEVKYYRDQVRHVVDKIITESPMVLPIAWDSVFWIVLMGAEHERIHFETSSVLFRQLPIDQVKPHSCFPRCTNVDSKPPANSLLPVVKGEVNLGKPADHKYYGWDNEYGEYTAKVPAFQASKYLVSNAEWLEFMNDDGYTTERYWTAEGWKWCEFRKKVQGGTQYPYFWVPQKDRTFRFRTMTEEIVMPWAWPVEVVNLEAKAFCNWKAEKTGKSIRLPTENEWARLRSLIREDQTEWEKAPGNINLEYYASSCPVDEFGHESGFHDITGNVWQHMETPIDAFRGFKVHPLYDDFSVPTFDTKHSLIKGGSWISTGNEATFHSRYAFRRHFIQHAGFRYVDSDTPVIINDALLETDPAVCQSAQFQYGPDFFGVSNYAKALAEYTLTHTKGRATKRAMDLGCRTGRAAFELAKGFDYVIGVDSSARFIRIPLQLQSSGAIRFQIPDEGELMALHERTVDELKLDPLVIKKCEFYQADACNMDCKKYSNYDLVLASNLVDSVYDPKRFLSVIHEFINRGGLLVLSSANNWNEATVPKKFWVGGYKEDGERVDTLTGLHSLLKAHFRQVVVADLPYVQQLSKRTFSHVITEVSVWERL